MAKATAIFNMATKIDIANQALSLLGDATTITSINPPDGSTQAGNVSRWYPIALRRLEEENEWTFLTKATRPAMLGSDYADLYGFSCGFQLPADCVRVIGVYQKASDQHEVPYKVAVNADTDSLMILTDEESPIIRYVAHIDKPTIYPQYFVECLVTLLCIYLIGPIKESNYTNQTLASLEKMYATALTRAKTADAQTGRYAKTEMRIPSHLKARGV